MANVECIWDLGEDPEGNVRHIAEHGITIQEAEEVVQACYEAAVASRSSGRPTVFGWTSTGKHLAVIFEAVDEARPQVYVVTGLRGTPARRTQTTEEEAMNHKQRNAVQKTPARRGAHQAIRDAFRDWHPGPEELIASGVAARLGLNVIHSPAQELIRHLKDSREAAGLTLADLSARCGIDQPALSRLENGRVQNPTLDTLWRYAAAVGQRLVLSTEVVRDTRLAPTKAGHHVPKKAGARKKKTA